MYTYGIKLIRVVDGDTIRADIDLGFDMWIKNVSIRFAGINAPETRTRDLAEKARGIEAKKEVEFILKTAKEIKIIVSKLGKYGRPIAQIIVPGYNKRKNFNLNDYLVENGFAIYKEY